MLEQMRFKYNIQRDMNIMFRKFYSRTVLDKLKKDEFMSRMDQMFRDFNEALISKDNFIARNMDILEDVVDKKSLLSDETRFILCGDLDKEIEEQMQREKKEKGL